MAKTKIILASTLSVLAVAGVTTAAVVVTTKNKDKQKNNPELGKEQDPAKKIKDGKKDGSQTQTPETEPNKDNTQTQTPETGKNNNNNQTNPQKIVQNKNDFKEINDAIKNEYDKENQIINEYDDNVAKYWEEQIKKNKQPNSVESPNNQPQSDGPEAGSVSTPNQDKKESENSNPSDNVKDLSIDPPTGVWEGVDKEKRGYITYTFKTSKSDYLTLKKAKKITFVFDMDGFEDHSSPATKWNTDPNNPLLIIKEKYEGDMVTFEMSPEYYFNKQTLPKNGLRISLKGLYLDDNMSKNILKKASLPVEIKWSE